MIREICHGKGETEDTFQWLSGEKQSCSDHKHDTPTFTIILNVGLVFVVIPVKGNTSELIFPTITPS